jgi:putative oxidoreductase
MEAQTRSSLATDAGLLLVRLALGGIFFAHGSQKVFGWFGGPGLGATVESMKSIGIPAILGCVAAFTELLGGLAVATGILARLGAAGLAVVMGVAVFLVHWSHGLFAQDHGFEYPMMLGAAALAIAVAGPGRIAVADWEPRLVRLLRR